MARRLVLVPGRAQGGRSPQALGTLCIDSLRKGMAKNHLHMPVAAADIRIASYGDAFEDPLAATPAEQVAQFIVRGRDAPSRERDFMLAMLRQVAFAHGITEGEIQQQAGRVEEDRNWDLVRRILQVLGTDRSASSAARELEANRCAARAATIAIAARDLYQYLFYRAVADVVDDGMRAAMRGSESAVVVSHSLGTVVAFMTLNEATRFNSWNVPLLVTLGSPLAVTEIRRRLMPLKHPACVGQWFNAMDAKDVVALYPLGGAGFPVERKIENWTHVENFTDDHHGIEGYLEDRVVARRIYDALVSAEAPAVEGFVPARLRG